MSDCSDFQAWDSSPTEGRRATLETLINDALDGEGYDRVNVQVGDLGGYDENGGGTYAETYQEDDGTITITFDRDHLDNESPQEMVDTSLHEVEHAKQYQDGEDYGELDEIDAWDAGSAAGVEWIEDCQPDVESASDDGGGDGWNFDSIPSSPDGIEFDWEHMGEGWTL